MKKKQKRITLAAGLMLIIILFLGYAFDPILSAMKYYYKILPLNYSLSHDEALNTISKYLSQLNIQQDLPQVNQHKYYNYGYDEHSALDHKDENGHFTPIFKPWPSWRGSSEDLDIIIHGETGQLLEIRVKANMNRPVDKRLSREEMDDKARNYMKTINSSVDLEFVGEELFLAYPERDYHSVQNHRFTFQYKVPIEIGSTYSGRKVKITEYEMYLLPDGEITSIRIIWDW